MTEEKMRQQLEQKLCKLEAQEACRNLMGRYSYYRTAFQNKEMVELWAKRDDAKLVTPWGSYQGHRGIEACYLKDIGDRSDAKVFEAIKGAVIMHEIDTEVIEVAEDLQTAKAAFFHRDMIPILIAQIMRQCMQNGHGKNTVWISLWKMASGKSGI